MKPPPDSPELQELIRQRAVRVLELYEELVPVFARIERRRRIKTYIAVAFGLAGFVMVAFAALYLWVL